MAESETAEKRKALEGEMIPKRDPGTGPFDRFFRKWLETVLVVALLGVFLALIVGGGWVDEIRQTQDDIIDDRKISRENGFKNRSVACLTLIVDNDREFRLPAECVEQDILKYYPPRVCEDMGSPAHCGLVFQPSEYRDPMIGRES